MNLQFLQHTIGYPGSTANDIPPIPPDPTMVQHRNLPKAFQRAATSCYKLADQEAMDQLKKFDHAKDEVFGEHDTYKGLAYV